MPPKASKRKSPLGRNIEFLVGEMCAFGMGSIEAISAQQCLKEIVALARSAEKQQKRGDAWRAYAVHLERCMRCRGSRDDLDLCKRANELKRVARRRDKSA